MIKKLLFVLVLLIPMSLAAQDNDPFGGGGGGSNDDPFGSGGSGTDPFGSSTPAPNTPNVPTTTQPDTEVFDPAPSDTTDDNSFGFGDDSSSDSSGGFGAPTSGPGGSGFGGGGDLFENLVDTLQEPLVQEFPWKQKAINDRPVLANYDVQEDDVFWAKTVFREIDVREKLNHPFAYPRAPFMTILLDIVQKNDIAVYKEDFFSGREFSEESNWDDVKSDFVKTEDVTVYDLDASGNEIELTETITESFRSSKVKRFKIKEVWYFDKKHSRMKVRIMGIAPLVEVTAADLDADAVLVQQLGLTGQAAQQTLFWVFFPDLREHLARYETINPLNDALRMSWDDLLTSRYFSSYITKTSNPLDRKIEDYTKNKLEALYESEKIKEEIFNFEHDLWTY